MQVQRPPVGGDASASAARPPRQRMGEPSLLARILAAADSRCAAAPPAARTSNCSSDTRSPLQRRAGAGRPAPSTAPRGRRPRRVRPPPPSQIVSAAPPAARSRFSARDPRQQGRARGSAGRARPTPFGPTRSMSASALRIGQVERSGCRAARRSGPGRGRRRPSSAPDPAAARRPRRRLPSLRR